MTLFVERPWRTQPLEAVPVRPGGFRHLVYGPHLGGVDGGVWTPVNAPPVIVGAVGQARQFTAASTQALTTPARGIDPLNLTMYALIKRRNTSGNHSILSAGAGSNDRVLLYLPNAAVAIFSGAGGTTGQASTTVSSYTDTANYVPIVARVSGSSFRDVNARFSDGSTITASNTTSASPAVPTVVAAGAYYTSGALTAGFYADADIAAAGVIPYAVSDRQLEDLLRNLNEYAQWLEPRSIWVPVSAASSTAAITSASGAATASALAGASTAATTVSAAAGASTASTIAGAATAAAATSAAAGAATASTMAGNATSAATIAAASGAATASTAAGASTAASAISSAAGVSTASTLTGVTGTGANISAAAGVATASAMAGAATVASAISAASGAATASDIAGASTAAATISAAAGAATAGTLAGSTVGDSSAISPAAGVASAQIIVGASFAAGAIGAATGAATCSALVGGGGLVVLSAPPLGHGPAATRRTTSAGRSRAAQLSTRTR